MLDMLCYWRRTRTGGIAQDVAAEVTVCVGTVDVIVM